MCLSHNMEVDIMSETDKIEIIREILTWKHHDDSTKRYFIQSFLLGWVGADQIHGVTERDNY